MTIPRNPYVFINLKKPGPSKKTGGNKRATKKNVLPLITDGDRKTMMSINNEELKTNELIRLLLSAELKND